MCKHFEKCGNCQYLDTPYAKQLQIKTEIVKEYLSDFDCKVLPCLPSSAFSYRNKAHLVFAQGREGVYTGFFNDVTHAVVDVASCKLHGEWFATVSKVLRDWAHDMRLTAFEPWTGKGILRFAAARCLGKNLMLTIVATTDKVKGLTNLLERLQKEFSEVSLYLNVNKRKDCLVLDEGNFRFVGGEKKLKGEIMGVKFELSPDSFFQVNVEVMCKAYEQILREISQSGRGTVVDLFSGIGITSALFAKAGMSVYSIEMNSDAVNDAAQIAKINGVEHLITQMQGDATEEFSKIRQLISDRSKQKSETQRENSNQITQDCPNENRQRYETKSNEKVALFVDPPRKGLGKKLSKEIAKFGADKIVYLSCNAASLAQDLEELTASYSLALLQPFDMFPMTSHVETLILLCRK